MLQCDIMWQAEKNGETSKWNKALSLTFALIQKYLLKFAKFKVRNIIEEIILCRKRLNVYCFVWRPAAEHSVVLKHWRISNSKKKTREDYRNTIFWSVQALGHPFHEDKCKISLSGLLVNWKYLSQNKAGLIAASVV